MINCAYLACVRNMLVARGFKISSISVSGTVQVRCNLLQHKLFLLVMREVDFFCERAIVINHNISFIESTVNFDHLTPP